MAWFPTWWTLAKDDELHTAERDTEESGSPSIHGLIYSTEAIYNLDSLILQKIEG